MKNLILLLFFIGISFTVSAQLTNPRSEFALGLSTPTVAISGGESREIKLSILRSKAYAKSPAKFGLSSAVPQGITVIFDENTSSSEYATVRISATKDVIAGNYMIILNTTIRNKKKGTTLKLVVGEPVKEDTAALKAE
jgi:hypothetical protein